MSYAVKEIFATLQGEGAHAGRASVFCRFAGCNLWSGREEDRHRAACQFCDTDFVGTDGIGGGRFADAAALTARLLACWKEQAGEAAGRYVVFTGGEPLLQIDPPLITAMHEAGFEIAIESNGTIAVPEGIDWICVSPKPQSRLIQCRGQELKLVYPQEALPPALFESWDFDHFWLQPMDGPDRIANTEKAVAYCLSHPRWRLSLQTHKLIGIP
ncbi:7-carboxy-7-deazaguanine synthase [Asaia sp. W19]|uniref:7-carboxy-7-deazaguanine synthase n=1 Tax=unclassified Asaia TaxID=2685023 RepID=UPI000F8EDD17|nr:7-carboxy-7-deazaguanine synthase [Asaia sp. W19]RUT24591.1 7-carboxy-7-deazaguanine synthase [Asaia sp. W19]RUT24816.1 7-carboxy-7-deazaguanine synthase [Asaia sp. W19]